MELKPGYKQTDIGVIPDDWAVEKLGKRVLFRTGPFGSALHKSDYSENGIPVINPMHIVEGRIVPTKTMCVTQNAANLLHDFKLQSGDVIIGRRGDMGRCAVVRENEIGWLCGTGSLIIRCTKQIAPDFLQRVLSSPRVVSAIEDTAVGTTMINLNQSILACLDIQFPPLPEQQAIAEALSDVDALLSALDALLVKKRHIKQGAMQELLTGHKRLSGFTDDWEVKTLGAILKVKHGKSQQGISDVAGIYQILATGGEIGRTNTALYDKPSVLIGRKGTIDAPQYMSTPFWTIDTLFYTEISEQALAKYIFYKFQCIDWRSYNEASGVPSLNASTIEKIEITLPDIEEQQAITEVLSDMDLEIETLEQRRDKTRNLKQGMMQELLTGQKRLR